MVLPHAAKDLVRDASTECSDCFLFCVAGGQSVLDVVVSTSAEADLGNSDAVQSSVQLTIATTVEAVTFVTSRPDRDGSTAVMHCKPGRCLETTDACSLANQLGSAESRTSI